jgi:hypothetical protein
LPVFVLRHERLLEAPEEVEAALVDFLRVQGFAVRPAPTDELHAFLDTGLRRARLEDSTLGESSLSSEQAELVAATNAFAGPHKSFAPPSLPP